MLSSSNFPTLRFSQRLPFRLSNRTNAFSKWKAPVESAEGRSENEMFLYSVPVAHMSKPERSNPCVVTLPLICVLVAFPGTGLIYCFFLLSRCHWGVIRKVIGKYPGS